MNISLSKELLKLKKQHRELQQAYDLLLDERTKAINSVIKYTQDGGREPIECWPQLGLGGATNFLLTEIESLDKSYERLLERHNDEY